MNENQPPYIPDWDPSKKYPRDPSYIHSFLHYMGLKCLTTGHIRVHYLNPEKPETPKLPDLAILGNARPILVCVDKMRGEEQDEDVPGTADLAEWMAEKLARDYLYWNFFIESGSGQEYSDADLIYTERNRIVVDWAEVPGQPDPDEIPLSRGIFFPDFTFKSPVSAQKVAAKIGATPVAPSIDSAKIRKINRARKGPQFISPENALLRYHIDGRFSHVFDSMQAFLVLGDLTFLCSNFWWGHRDLEDEFPMEEQ